MKVRVNVRRKKGEEGGGRVIKTKIRVPNALAASHNIQPQNYVPTLAFLLFSKACNQKECAVITWIPVPIMTQFPPEGYR